METASVGVSVGLVLGALPAGLEEDLADADVDVVGGEVEEQLRDL